MADSRQATFAFGFDARSVNQAAQSFQKALTDASNNWGADVKKTFGIAVSTGFQSAMASGKSGNAIQSFVKSNITEVYGKFQKAFHANNMAEAQKHGRALAKIQSGLTRELQSQVAATDKMAQLQARTGTQRANDWKGMLQSIRGGDLGGLATGAGSRVQTMGRARQDQGRELQQAARLKGDQGGMDKGASMAKFGSMIAKIGKVAMAFAAVAGIVVVLVKMFMDLEKRAKDMNKVLMATAGAGDFGMSAVEIKGGDLTKQLEKIRDETTAVNDNFMKFRAVAGEQQKILSTLNEAGYSYGKMNEQIQKGTKFMKSYSDVTALALTYSRNLGVDSGKIAGDMGAFTLETGQSLDEIAKGFSVIQQEAMVAGFVTKRFYASVIEATSGMAYYGVTIGETAQILANLDGLMGEALGPEMLKEVTGKGKGMSATDRIRDMILKDPEFIAEQFSKAFARKKDGIARDLGDTIGKVLGEGETLDSFLGQDEQTIRDRLAGTMSAPEIERVTQASVLGRAGQGDRGAMQRGYAFAGQGFDLATASSGTGVFDGKRIDEVFREIGSDASLKDAGFAALATSTGKSFDELERLNTLFGNAEANLRKLRGLAESDPDKRSKEDEAFLEDMSDVFGVTIDEATKEIKRGNLKIEDALDFVAGTEEATAAELGQQLTKDQELATEISSNITGLSEIMEQGTNAILENIYQVVAKIAGFLFRDSPEENAQLTVIEDAKRDREKAQLALKAARAQEKSAKKRLTEAEAGGDKTAIAKAQKELAAAGGVTALAAKVAKDTIAKEQVARTFSQEDHKSTSGGVGTKTATAIETARGGKLFETEGHKKTAFNILARAMPRGMSGEQMGMAGFGSDIDEWEDTYMKRAMATEEGRAAIEDVGGEDVVRKAVQQGIAAVKGHEEYDSSFYTRWDKEEFASLFSSGMETSLPEGMQTLEEREAEAIEEAEQQKKVLEDILEELKQSNMGGLFGKLFSGAKGADDFILPSGGGPMIIPDENDTIVGFKPGGPIASGGGGGGGGSVNVNIYGGDQKKVYDTVMRVMKVLGHA